MRELHIQVGVDGVLESLQGDLIELSSSSTILSDIAVISEEVFNSQLRDPINGAQQVDGEALLDRKFPEVQKIVICRPKFLFAGKPMNLENDEYGASYKISALQNIFPTTRIVFHLFITDHASYLHSHLNWLGRNGTDTPFTWVPLVEAIRKKLVRSNRLCLWNAESTEGTRSDYLAELFGVSSDDISSFFMLMGTEVGVPSQDYSTLENDLLRVGGDLHVLDDAFEADLEWFQL